MYPTLVQTHDAELKKRILIALQTLGIDSVDVEIEVKGGVVLLSGQYSSRHEQQLAVECCRHVAGVLRIEDLTTANLDFTSSDHFEDECLSSPSGGYASFSAT